MKFQQKPRDLFTVDTVGEQNEMDSDNERENFNSWSPFDDNKILNSPKENDAPRKKEESGVVDIYGGKKRPPPICKTKAIAINFLYFI